MGLMCTLSLHLLLVFFLVVWRLALQLFLTFTDSVCGFPAIRSLSVRLDFETLLPDRSSKYRQTDPRKSAKNCQILGKAYMFKVEC